MRALKHLFVAACAVGLLGPTSTAAAHPAPFSYVDIRIEQGAVEVGIVAHVFDVGHDLGIDPSDRLLDPAVVASNGAAITALIRDRFSLAADARTLGPGAWSPPEALPDRQSIRVNVRYEAPRSAGMLSATTLMFPYDPQHQTFLNFYENGSLTSQAILDRERTTFEYFAGTRQGVLAVVRRFVPAGVHHILIGPDHLLFLVGLLLLGGTLRQLAFVVTAFTIAHSATLSLAALNLFSPPARIVEPAIALSIVYVGADNLMVRDGRDVRAWIAFAFGFIHGFGFANVLREMDLPRQALGWSLFSFNIGVEIGQLAVVVAVATILTALRTRSAEAGRRLAIAGSIGVIVAGAYWFIERVFFPGGMA